MPTSSTKKTVKKAVKKVGVAKAPAKKTAAKKKPVQKEANFKALVCAFDGECFWSRDGQILQNLADLRLAIGSMDDEVFLHHVSPEKNDFADWVEHVLQDSECAEALRKAKKKEQAEKIVQKHLSSYNIT
jgi:hypothetical protein